MVGDGHVMKISKSVSVVLYVATKNRILSASVAKPLRRFGLCGHADATKATGSLQPVPESLSCRLYTHKNLCLHV